MRQVPLLGWCATVAFAASWFLPVLDGVPGWMAFRYALAPLLPYGDYKGPGAEDNIPQVLSALTNVVFVMLFALWLARQMFRPGLFLRISLACFLLNLYWPVQAIRHHQLGDLQVGYYVWQTAFALLSVAALLSVFSARRTSRTPTADTPT